MPSRDLIYRVSIPTSDARRSAANVRATFERELRTITLGRLDTSALTRGVTEAQRLRQELEAAGRASANIRPPTRTSPAASQLPADGGFLFSGIDGAVAQVQGLVASYIGLQGVIAAIDLSKLGTQALRTYASLNILSGGGKQTEEVLNAIQKASNGTVTELEAAGIATQGFALKLARTPAEFEKLTRAAREIVQVSPIINDVSEALTQLALFASNEQSFARADQLGLAVGEVKDRMAELRRENDALSGSQAKLLASVQLLDEKYGATLDTIEAQATGIERLRVAWEDAKVSFATADFGFVGELFSVDKFAGSLATAIEIASGNYTKMEAVVDSVGRSVQFLENRKNAYFFPEDTTDQIEQAKQRLELYKKASEDVTRAVAAGVPGAVKYQTTLDGISEAASISGGFTDEQVAQLRELSDWYNQAALAAVTLSEAEKLRAENKITADQFEQTRQGNIFEQQPAIESALASRAAKAAPTVGLEAAIATYRQQKAAVDAAIQQLIDSGVSDQNELAIRVADITQQLLAPFDELEARASTIDLTAALGNFDQVGIALGNLNAGFTDFLPGVAAARDELTTLSNEMALTGELSDEQAARLDYLSQVAYSVADGGSQLSAVIAELGYDFLESNAYAAELVNQLFLTEAAFRSNQIGAGEYAGITAILSGQLLTLADSAGIATGAIYALNDAQSDMASPAGLAIGGSIAERIQSQQQSSGREQNRREMDRYNRDMERAQERSAGRAGKLLEDGAKKANQELKSALDKVPGLFSTTQVTEQDMNDAKMGVYQEKADEYLRRLRDEVQNGRDWEDVSIEEARAGLERAGLEVGATAEQTLILLERAMNDQSLYSAVENIPIFINEEAVKEFQELQKKSEEGRKNVYAYFGVQVDEAVTAATGGGGAAVEVKPPELIDIDPLTEGLQTGLDDVITRTGDAVQTALQNAPNAFFDPSSLFGAGGKTGAMGPMAKPTVTVTADASAQAWGPVVSGEQPAQVTLAPTIDAAGIQTQLDQANFVMRIATIALAEGVRAPDISVMGKIDKFAIDQTALYDAKISIPVELDLPQQQTNADGSQAANAITPLITDINTQIRSSQEQIKNQGITIAQILMAGLVAYFKGSQQTAGGEQAATPLADALMTNVATQFAATQNMFYAVGFGPAMSVESGFKDYGYTGLSSGLLDALTTGIRTDAENYMQRGATIAGYVQAGMNQQFSAETGVRSAITAGAAWGNAFMQGVFEALNGAGFVDQITTNVIDGITGELEQP